MSVPYSFFNTQTRIVPRRFHPQSAKYGVAYNVQIFKTLFAFNVAKFPFSLTAGVIYTRGNLAGLFTSTL